MLNLLLVFHFGHAHLNRDFSAFILLAVHRLDGLSGMDLIGEFNKAEATVLVVRVIQRHSDINDITELGKQ